MSETSNQINDLPNHIGFIVDGNRRWAKSRGLPTQVGHKKGFEVLKQMAYLAQKRHIKYVSAFIFSTENWNRSETEVNYLMKLFLSAFQTDMKKMIRDGFRIIFLGRRNRLSRAIVAAINEAEDGSRDNNGVTLALCFNYGGRAEIIDAARHLAADVDKNVIEPSQIDEAKFKEYIYQPDLPDIDMVVRTSGEERISGFMLWRIAYSEFMFIDKNWPDMTESDFDDILAEYSHRQRRFGK